MPNSVSHRVLSVENAETESFVDLTEIARLDRTKSFRNLNLGGANFSNCSLEGYDFRGSNIYGCIFDNTNLDGAIFDFEQWVYINKIRMPVTQKSASAKTSPDNYDALLKACAEGRIEEIIRLSEMGLDINHRVSGKPTNLIAAIRGGHVGATTFLLERGADFHRELPSGRDALFECSATGSNYLVDLLLKLGADPNRITTGSTSKALLAATIAGHGKIVQMLLKAGASTSSREPTDITNSVFYAAIDSYHSLDTKKAFIDLFVRFEANVNSKLRCNGNTISILDFALSTNNHAYSRLRIIGANHLNDVLQID